MPTLTAYCSSTPATHEALPDKLPGAESAESAATGPAPSSNFHQFRSVAPGVAVGVALGVIVDVIVDVDVALGVGLAVEPVGVGVGVGADTIAVALISVEFALFPLPSVPPV